jgi:hypothetical protein
VYTFKQYSKTKQGSTFVCIDCVRNHSSVDVLAYPIIIFTEGTPRPERINQPKNHYFFPQPLLHLPQYQEDGAAQVSEKAVNLQDAMLCLKTAIEQVQRFL